MHRGAKYALTIAVVAALAAACSSNGEVASRPAEVTFPKGFLWGSATAAFQVESGDTTTDWYAWAKTPGKIKNGDDPDQGPNALAHVDDDIAALVTSKQNAYRFSIEWSRIYPTRAAFDADTPDAAAIAAYDGLLGKLRAASITPMVTLQHFSLPSWLSDPSKPNDPQGWERPEAIDLFVEFSRRMAARFGDKVDWWITINEPLNLVLGGYVQGSFPPGLALELTRGLKVAKTETLAHARAFDAIHAADTIDADGDGKPALVSFAAHQRTFHPLDPTDPEDVAATDRVRNIWNRWFLNAVVHGDWDDDYDGTYTGPGDKKGDPSLANHLDYVGVNYYSDTLISRRRGIVVPVVDAVVVQVHMPTDRAKTEMAWDIYPEGFGTVLDEAAQYKLPIVVTENGIADSSDTNRPRFLAAHLFELGLAKTRGADIRGYFHWSLVDNFEWANGFCPKFGLFAVDRATGARTPRPSVRLYSAIIAAGKVRQADIDTAAPYATPASFCE